MRYYDAFVRQLNYMGTWEWFAVLLVVLGLGMVCMRGFGSRTGY